jgi:hypothetical protein
MDGVVCVTIMIGNVISSLVVVVVVVAVVVEFG